jgi:hypothetical protein
MAFRVAAVEAVHGKTEDGKNQDSHFVGNLRRFSLFFKKLKSNFWRFLLGEKNAQK